MLCCAVLSCVVLCRVGVSSEPQHKQLELTPADKVLVLASDGECCQTKPGSGHGIDMSTREATCQAHAAATGCCPTVKPQQLRSCWA